MLMGLAVGVRPPASTAYRRHGAYMDVQTACACRLCLLVARTLVAGNLRARPRHAVKGRLPQAPSSPVTLPASRGIPRSCLMPPRTRKAAMVRRPTTSRLPYTPVRTHLRRHAGGRKNRPKTISSLAPGYCAAHQATARVGAASCQCTYALVSAVNTCAMRHPMRGATPQPSRRAPASRLGPVTRPYVHDNALCYRNFVRCT